MKTDIRPTVDYAFKRLFGSEENLELTIDLLNAILEYPEGKPIRQLTLLNPLTDTEYAGAKVSIYDILVRDQINRHHHLEMQLKVPWSFDKRIVYYLAKIHGGQMQVGDYYETLMPTSSSCFIAGAMFDHPSYHSQFTLIDRASGTQFSKDLDLRLIELGKFALPVDQVRTPRERWCYFLKHGDTLDPEALPRQLDTPMIRKAMEVLVMLSQDEKERYKYLERLFIQMDEAEWKRAREELARDQRNFAQAKNTLEQEKSSLEQEKSSLEQEKTSLARTREELVQKGEHIGLIRSFQRILKQPLASREDLQNLPLDELMRLAQDLERQVLAGGA